MFAHETFQNELPRRDFICQYSRNQLHHPSFVNSSLPSDQYCWLIIHGIYDIPFRPILDKTPFIRIRATYFNQDANIFIGRTYTSSLQSISERSACTLHSFQEPLLLTLSSLQKLSVVIELSIQHEDKEKNSNEEIGVGIICIDLSNREVGKRKSYFLSCSPRSLIIKQKLSKMLNRR